MRTATVAGLDQQLGIGLEEGHGHRDLTAIRQHAICMPTEGLDVAEDVVPAATVETDDAALQRMQDFVHLEYRWQGFDQPGRVSISTVTFIAPMGSPSRTSTKVNASSHNAASSIDCNFGR